MPLASHERSRSMGHLQGFRRGPVVPTTSPQGAFRNSLRKLKLFSFTPASPSSRKTRCAIFAGALKLSHKTRCAIFAGALKMSAMVGALFFVRQGREAAFTTLPPLFVRHPPLHREGYNKITPSAARPLLRARGTSLIGLPKKICLSKDFLGKGRESAFLAKPQCGFDRFRAWKRRIVRAVSGLPRRCEADAWEEEQRGHYRARKAGAKSAAVAVRRSLAYAPCGDAGGKEISIALRRRGRQGKNGKLRHLLPQSRCRCSIGQQDSSLKKAPIMRRWLNNPSGLPFASHRLGGARKTPPRSGNFPTMGNFQARKWSTPHRGVAKKAFARPLHRGG